MNYIQHEQVKGRYEAFVLREFDDVDLFWDRVLEEDIYARVLEVVQELPRQYRNVMMLSLDGYKISEVAEKMGISLETAKLRHLKRTERFILGMDRFFYYLSLQRGCRAR